ncbi:MAG: hypothetical protein AAF409_10170 [Pseudomonadota bacterium]
MHLIAARAVTDSPSGSDAVGATKETPEMTDQDPAHDAEMHTAVETLVTRLEKEHAWAVELRQDLAHTDREIGKLLSACDSAIQTLPQGQKLPYLTRCASIRLGPEKPGRPVADARYKAILDYLARRPDEEVRNTDIRLALRRQGLPDDSQYVANLLSRWAAEGMIARTGFGRYVVDGQDRRLRRLRMKPDPDSHRAQVRAEIAEGRAKAEDRFDEAVEAEKAHQKAREHARLRRENFYRPPEEWDPSNADYQARQAAEKRQE